MTITVNGSPLTDPPASIAQLLARFSLDPLRVAVELNCEILPQDEFPTTTLADGDQIEIVQFVGGG